MNLDDLLQILKLGHQTPRQAQEAHDRLAGLMDALRRFDEDSREQCRIDDIVDLIDAEDALYDGAVTAFDLGDQDRALPLLELAAKAGIGEATWLLAGLLEEHGQTAEAIAWYRRAADDGDSRAEAKLAQLYSRQTFINGKPLPGQSSEPPVALADSGSHLSLETMAVRSEPWRLVRCILDAAAWVTGTPAQRCNDFSTCWLPQHGTGTSPLGWFMEAPKVIVVEGPSDEHVLRHCLTLPDQIKVVHTNGCYTAADFAPDAAQTRDRRLYLYQVKSANKLLRHCRDFLRDPFFSGAIGGMGVTSWQVEHTAAQPLTAGDVMTPLAPVTTLTPGTTVHHAMGQMLQAGTDALPVCEGDQIVGVVTLADLARCVHDNRGILSIERVDTLMRPPVTVAMAAPVSAVRALMAYKSTSLAVVAGPGSKTVGCVTTQSLLAPETTTPHESKRTVPLLRPGGAAVLGCV